MVRQKLEEILRLAGDDSYSHAARMISIKKEAEAALKVLDAEAAAVAEVEIAAEAKKKAEAAHGAKTGNPIQEPNKAPAGAPAK